MLQEVLGARRSHGIKSSHVAISDDALQRPANAVFASLASQPLVSKVFT